MTLTRLGYWFGFLVGTTIPTAMSICAVIYEWPSGWSFIAGMVALCIAVSGGLISARFKD